MSRVRQCPWPAWVAAHALSGLRHSRIRAPSGFDIVAGPAFLVVLVAILSLPRKHPARIHPNLTDLDPLFSKIGHGLALELAMLCIGQLLGWTVPGGQHDIPLGRRE